MRISCSRSIAASAIVFVAGHPFCAPAYIRAHSVTPPITNARQRTACNVAGQYASGSMNINIILAGALAGTIVALALLTLEYALLRRNSAERARRTRRSDVFDGAERSRMGSLVRFCILLPAVFAAVFWLVWD